jgi:hypothetical protein
MSDGFQNCQAFIPMLVGGCKVACHDIQMRQTPQRLRDLDTDSGVLRDLQRFSKRLSGSIPGFLLKMQPAPGVLNGGNEHCHP